MIAPYQNTAAAVPTLGDIVAGTSVMFLFSPRQIINHYKRPIDYNFNNAIIDSIAENIMNQPSLGSVNKVMKSTDLSSAIVPVSTGGIHVNTSNYSQNWMFVIIVDVNPEKNYMLSNKLSGRSIFIGICADDPISHSGLHSATPEQFLNPNCQLIVTRSLELSKFSTLGANGAMPQVRTMNDLTVAQYDDSVWKSPGSAMATESFYSLTPADINSAASVSDNAFTSIVDSGDSLNVKGKISLPADIESPTRHMKEILTAFESGYAHQVYGDRVGNFGDGAGAMSMEPSDLTSYVNSAFDVGWSGAATSGVSKNILTANYITIGMIQSMYHPRVNIINTPQSTPADIIPQDVRCINTVFSSLVCAVIPSYLNAVGLSAVSFMYNSAAEAAKVLHVESALNLTPQELHSKYLAFEYLLKTDLYPILLGNGGHFDIQVMSSVNSTTDVVLNFLDFTLLPNGTIYQENTVLGGIVSPLIGTKDHLIKNSIQLTNLIRNVASASHHANVY